MSDEQDKRRPRRPGAADYQDTEAGSERTKQPNHVVSLDHYRQTRAELHGQSPAERNEEEPWEPDPEDFLWDEEEEEDAPPPRSPWIRRTVLIALALALVGNIIAFWPQIYNFQTLPFLSKSKELSSRADIQDYKRAVVAVGTEGGKGTGFHLQNGYILTNYHVIEDGPFTLIKFPEHDRSWEAVTVASDPALDIAILKAELDVTESLPGIALADEPAAEGSTIYIIGNPLQFTQIAAEGTAIGLVRLTGRAAPVLALNAPVYPGNSGSPVLNEEGRAVAVVFATGQIRQDGESKDVGYAIPIDQFRDMLPPG
ncbi:trypsin-like peptidase domain-containing protein [Paenibacillus sp. IB182496]|uniref:Trypsin-like peptidase domain-containing protein n=1 Tax=Paenibacillus sabuli TaxID=2772509 RepID=A0A927GU31_9BACL|nr:serine protease [Paenibacillus sabuli]MBD2847725.1 trypsin-like peptidase domain-containing protein [Paenibacillus sabuli]